MNLWRIACPHCGYRSTIRYSRPLSELIREAKVQCNNPDCGHSWIVHLEAVRSICPSRTPNPNINLPMSARSMQHTASEG